MVAVGLVISFSSRIPWLGKLPGDFTFRTGGVTIYLPLATCLLASVALSLIAYLFRR
jgi:hypothetical protein